jgi:hypothetical protein
MSTTLAVPASRGFAEVSCSLEPVTTYAQWVRKHKDHLKSLVQSSNRANRHGAHERTCPICIEGALLLKSIIKDRYGSLIQSSWLRFQS